MATTITANGINFPDGSASAPSIGGTDTNTGLFTGSDIVGFATGGVERIRIDANGNLSLGTTSPNSYTDQRVLTINGTTYGRLDLEVAGTLRGSIWANSGGLGIDAGANDIEMFTGSQQRLKINTSGQIGIGQGFNPSRQLDVKDSTGANRIMNIRGTGSSGAFLAFLDANTTDDSYVRVGCKAGNAISLRGNEHHFERGYDGASRMVIDSSGKVGIGVNDPAVAGGYHGMEIGGSANTGLRLSCTASSGWAFTDYEASGTQKFIAGLKGSTDPDVCSWRIAVGASLDSNVRFAVTENGKVGIGLTNPGFMADIRGATDNSIRVGNSNETGHGSHFTAIVHGASYYSKAYLAADEHNWYVNGASLARRMRLNQAGHLSLDAGNLEVASGNGIDFSATSDASGKTSELLDEYEEGNLTWYLRKHSSTSTGNDNGSLVKYTKVGRMVLISGRIRTDSVPSDANDYFYLDGSLPFTPSTPGTSVVGHWRSQDQLDSSLTASIAWGESNTTIYLYTIDSKSDYSPAQNNVPASHQTNLVMTFSFSYIAS